MPWLTIFVMALCTVTLVLTQHVDSSEARLEELADEYVEYLSRHPYLQADPEVEDILGPWLQGMNLGLFDWLSPSAEPDQAEIWLQQEELDEIGSELLDVTANAPLRRFGVIAENKPLLALVTYMFLHAGWIHLLGNLFIFYLSAPFIEDVWGRPIFAGFFILAGVVGALAHIARYPEATIPLVGASGAVAGVMGAYLIRFWKAKIRFFYWFGLIIRGTFWAPAWLMLPLWFFEQLFMAWMMDSAGIGGEGGVAHWTHVGGFAFGALFAYAMRLFKIEETYVHPGIEAKISTTLLANSTIERAMALSDSNREDEAFRMLVAEHRKHPRDSDVGWALWQVADGLGRAGEVAGAMLAVIREELRRNQVELALEHWRELQLRVPGLSVDPSALIPIARALRSDGGPGEAATLLERILDGSRPMTASQSLTLAELALGIDADVCRRAAEKVSGHPEATPEEQVRAEALLSDPTGGRNRGVRRA